MELYRTVASRMNRVASTQRPLPVVVGTHRL